MIGKRDQIYFLIEKDNEQLMLHQFKGFILCSLFIVSVSHALAQHPELDKAGNLISMDDVNIFSMVQPIPATNIFKDSLYNIWCGSVVKGKNGKFYMFYSRWPIADGHFAWVNRSEIALAVADQPGGPYRHVKVILAPRGGQYWDGTCTHNPAAIVYKGKYYLFYMGTTGNSTLKAPISMGDPNWWEYRNNQRIGVAMADDPEAVWERFDKPVLDIGKDSTAYDALMVSNPGITVDEQGRAILVYKEVGKNGKLQGGQVRFGVAFAKSLAGPFTKHPEPIFEAKIPGREGMYMMAEDPFLWHYKGVNYAIVRDVMGVFSKKTATWALLRSTDGIDWQPAKYPAVAPWYPLFADGTKANESPERPCLYLENGVPKVLFGALGITINNKRRATAENIAMPLK
ncbi:glycoside hydrolase family protein [Chitinophaga sp. RAB17]|uniref:glycoside hydrolase family protein n=1 Tax=Chitinophaga sp. RAB17 TaxID=3233049 RepID=UPI003F8F5235